MAARNKATTQNDVPSLKTLPNSKLSTIHEGSVAHPSKQEGVPRIRKRDLIASAWQETASRMPNFGGGKNHNQESSDDATIPQETAPWRSSIQSAVRESIQFGVMGPLALITAPFKGIPLSVPFQLQRKPSDAAQEEESTQIPVESRQHRFRPFAKRQQEATGRQRVGMTRQFSVMPINSVSVHELNATLVPVYKQSSWDMVALLLSYCSTGLHTGIAMVLFLIPSKIIRKWGSFFASSWPMEMIDDYWVWMIHLLHSGRQHAHTGSAQQTGTILAAGAALAAYNSSMQASYQPARRSKWRKK